MSSVRELEWDDPTEAVPAFLTMILIPFSFSIAAGVAAGFVVYAAAKLLTGRWRECPALVYVFAAAYLLWAIQRVLFNALDKPENARMPDRNWREIAISVPIVITIIWLDVYQAPVLRRMEPAAAKLVAHVRDGATPATVPTTTVAMKTETAP